MDTLRRIGISVAGVLAGVVVDAGIIDFEIIHRFMCPFMRPLEKQRIDILGEANSKRKLNAGLEKLCIAFEIKPVKMAITVGEF